VQNYVLRFIFHKYNILRTPHIDCENTLKLLNLEILKKRRTLSYNTFLSKLLNNEIDDSFLLSQLNFKVDNYDTRDNHLFYIPHFSKKYTSNDLINSLMSSGNSKLFKKYIVCIIIIVPILCISLLILNYIILLLFIQIYYELVILSVLINK